MMLFHERSSVETDRQLCCGNTALNSETPLYGQPIQTRTAVVEKVASCIRRSLFNQNFQQMEPKMKTSNVPDREPTVALIMLIIALCLWVWA